LWHLWPSFARGYGERSTAKRILYRDLAALLVPCSYDNASRAELLKAQNITRILNTVPTCQNLYKNSFTYHSLKEDKTLPFSECLEFIEQARLDKARVLVHCMSGQSRSPAVVIAYLMKHKQWRLTQSYQWVKDRRPSINLTQAVAQQLQHFESELFGNNAPSTPIINTAGGITFGFGFSTPSAEAVVVPTFASPAPNTPSLFGATGIPSPNFVFGAVKHPAMDHSMDG
jgi:dual specificity MAP kinase phosphatase